MAENKKPNRRERRARRELQKEEGRRDEGVENGGSPPGKKGGKGLAGAGAGFEMQKYLPDFFAIRFPVIKLSLRTLRALR